MKTFKVFPSEVSGTISAVPSKSISHRAIAASALSKGLSTIKNVVLSDDVLASLNAAKCLGSNFKFDKGSLILTKAKSSSLESTIDCKSSGTTLRLFMPALLSLKDDVTFLGTKSLFKRPLDPYLKIFKSQDIHYKMTESSISIHGRLKPGIFTIDGSISSQFITGLLFALPLLKKDSEIIIEKEKDLQSKTYVDLTIDVLKKSGIEIQNFEYKRFAVPGNKCYKLNHFNVEGDFSQAAFFLFAGALNGHVTVKNLNLDSLQGDKVIIDIIKSMGGFIAASPSSILAKHSSLSGITVDVSECPDLVPLIAAAACTSFGKTNIINAERLRFKETDRIKTTVSALKSIGADIQEGKDSITVIGKDSLNGGTSCGFEDHRIVMALTLASLKCKNPVIIKGADAVKKSYPNFFNDFKKIGGSFQEI